MTAPAKRAASAPLALAGLLAAMGLAGCAPSAQHRPTATPTRKPSPAATPAKGLARSVAFSVRLPIGWTDATSNSTLVSAVKPDGRLLLLLQGPPPAVVVRGVDDVAALVVVTQPRQQIADADVPAYLQSVQASGATDISPPTSIAVGGAGGTTVTYLSALGGTPIQTKDVVVSHGGAMYEVELITSQHAFPAAVTTFDQMLTVDWDWMSAD